MKIALASIGFRNGDISYNLKKIKDIIGEYGENVDLIVFGEAFLQGFDSLNWNYQHDMSIAVENDSEIIKEISEKAKEYGVGVSFGYIEKYENHIYSSQITIDEFGRVKDNYRRVSTGWKDDTAGKEYKEGKESVVVIEG